MRAALATAIALVLGSTGFADARHGHWRHRSWGPPSGSLTSPHLLGGGGSRRAARAYARDLAREFPPSDWQLRPPDPNWQGRRYVSPGGEAWLALYASPADPAEISAHLKSVAFADGEEIRTLAGDRTGVLVTGAKGDRIFVRKAKLACGGRQWHHIALEFPAGAQRAYQILIAQAVRAVDLSEDDGCMSPVAGNTPQTD